MVPKTEHVGDLMTADHKDLVKEVNRATIIDMPWWHKIWQLCGHNPTHVEQKPLRSLMKFLEPTRKAKVIVKNFPGIIVHQRQHRSETNEMEERAVRRVKEGTSAELLQSGLGNEFWADSMECCCYLRNIQDLLSDGKHQMKNGSEYHSTDL